MHGDHKKYFHFTGKYRLERAINSLLGLVEGVAIDREINRDELLFLYNWISDHEEVEDSHPFNELLPKVRTAVADKRFTEDEHADIVWLSRRLISKDHFVGVAPEIQKLHALLAGIAADRRVSIDELRGLSGWLDDHKVLSRTWPYEEACSLATRILSDQHISAEEHQSLLDFCGEFLAQFDSRVIVSPPIVRDAQIVGLCAVCPEIVFDTRRFCFTGASSRHTRKYLEQIVTDRGGICHDGVVKNLDYLVVGSDGNPCWAYACYGRKIERAVQLRREGSGLLIVHEHDFHDAVADHP